MADHLGVPPAHPLVAYENVRFKYGRRLIDYVHLHDFEQGYDLERNTWTVLRDFDRLRLTLELRDTEVQNQRLRHAHVRLCKRVIHSNNDSPWERQLDLDVKPVVLAPAAPAPAPDAPAPAAPAPGVLDMDQVANELRQAGGGAQRAGRLMLAATASLSLEPDPELDGMLGHSVERPNKVAVFGAPGMGKSYLMAHIVESLMPPDLVNIDEPAIRQNHARSTRDADMDSAPDVLTYCADLSLPHLDPVDDDDVDNPFFNPNEGTLLFPHAEGGSHSAVPINAIPTSFDDPRFVVRVRLFKPLDVIETVRVGVEFWEKGIEEERKLDERVQALELREQLQDGDCDAQMAAVEAAVTAGRAVEQPSKANKDDAIRKISDALAILSKDEIPKEAADRRVPREMGMYDLLEFHVLSKRLVHRITHRYTCIGHWGLVMSVDVLFPVAPLYRTINLTFVDMAGTSKEQMSRTARSRAELLRHDLAAIVLVTGGREVSGDVTGLLNEVEVSDFMISTPDNAYPISVLAVDNAGYRRTGKYTFAVFNKIYEKAGNKNVGNKLAERKELHKRPLIKARVHSQTIFTDGDALKMSINDLDPDTAQDLLIPAFMTKLIEMVQEGSDLMGQMLLRHRVFPKIRQHFYMYKERLDIIAALAQMSHEDKAKATARLLSPDVDAERMIHQLDLAAQAAAAREEVRVALLPVNRPTELMTAMEECTTARVNNRRLAAEGDVNHPCHALVIHGNKNLHRALQVGPLEDVRLPTLIIGNLWNVASDVVVRLATPTFVACIQEMCDNFRIRARDLLFDVEDEGQSPNPLIECIERHFDRELTLGVLEGDTSVVESMRLRLERILSNDQRDDVISQVMKEKFAEVYGMMRGRIQPRLRALSTWAPIAANGVLEQVHRKVLAEWMRHDDLMRSRCVHIIDQVRVMATGVNNGDYDTLDPALIPLRNARNQLAWMLNALGDSGFSPMAHEAVLIDAATALQEAQHQQPLPQLPQLPQLPPPAPAAPPPLPAQQARCTVCGTTMLGTPTFATVALGPVTIRLLNNSSEEGLMPAVRDHFRPPALVCANCQKHVRNRIREQVEAGGLISFDFFDENVIDDTYLRRSPHVTRVLGVPPPQPEHLARPAAAAAAAGAAAPPAPAPAPAAPAAAAPRHPRQEEEEEEDQNRRQRRRHD